MRVRVCVRVRVYVYMCASVHIFVRVCVFHSFADLTPSWITRPGLPQCRRTNDRVAKDNFLPVTRLSWTEVCST